MGLRRISPFSLLSRFGGELLGFSLFDEEEEREGHGEGEFEESAIPGVDDICESLNTWTSFSVVEEARGTDSVCDL